MKKRILIFGDSLTWGYNPKDGSRIDYDKRYPGIVANILGSDYEIIEDGINGRTTCFDPGWGYGKDGKAGLGYALLRSYPIDCVVIMLGINDLVTRSAEAASDGISQLVRNIKNAESVYCTEGKVFNSNAKILLMAPVSVNQAADNWPIPIFRNTVDESKKLAGYYKQIAIDNQIDFLDANQYSQSSVIDGLHMDEDNHYKLAVGVANKLKEMLDD